MHVEMRYVLERDLAVSDEQVDAARAKRVPDSSGKISGDSERAHRGSLIEVRHQHRMLARHHQDVAVRDGLDVHESDDGVVFVDEGCGGIAPQDLAEHALICHLVSAKLKAEGRSPWVDRAGR